MAKRSSRKSSSGDEALLWGIAAVVVAVAGVGAAIMLTRNNKPPTPSPPTPVKPVSTDTSCYRELKQGTGKDIKYFVQKEQNMKQANGNCPQGWVAQSNANNLKAGTYKTIEVNEKNQCYNNYLMPPDYKTAKPECLQAGDCDTTSFTDSKCKTQWTPPPCRRGPGFSNSNCNVMRCSDANDSATCSEGGTDDNGQACCVWEQEPPKPAPAATKNKKQRQKPSLPKPTAMCCATSTGMNTYDNNDSKNPPELQCRMAGPDETSCGKLDPNCKWTIPAKKQMTKVGGCILGKCCGGEDCNNYSDESVCEGKSTVSNTNCYWDPTGKCNTENFRMRRRRR